MSDPPQIIDSVTRLEAGATGRIVVAGSHAGIYAAYLLARARVRGAVLNDAGIGRDRAGIAGLDYLERLGIAAATVGHRTARIGDGRDCYARGRITHLNAMAADAGLRIDMPAAAATATLIERATRPQVESPARAESRRPVEEASTRGTPVHIMDSVSLLTPDDVGAIALTGSHGGCLGGRPETAAKVDVYAAVYNDADIGIDDAGISRLPALDARGIAAATVSAWSARIGDGASTWADGVISRVNSTAAQRGAAVGLSVSCFASQMIAARLQGR